MENSFISQLVDSMNLTPGVPVFIFNAPSGATAIFQFLVNEQDKRIAVDVTWIIRETSEDREALTAYIQAALGSQMHSQVESHSSSAREASGKIDHFLRTGVIPN